MKDEGMKWNDVERRSVGVEVDVIERMAIDIVVAGETGEVVRGVEAGRGVQQGEMKPKNVVDGDDIMVGIFKCHTMTTANYNW